MAAPDLDVFLNVPYDRYFVDLFLAYTAGLTSLGLFPRATLEIAGGERRLDRSMDPNPVLSSGSRPQAVGNASFQHALRTRLSRGVTTGSTKESDVVCI